MSQKGKTLLKGHTLIGEGHPSTKTVLRDGKLSFWHEPRTKVAHCSCGAASPEGLSIKGNQRWHREHKDSLRG